MKFQKIYPRTGRLTNLTLPGRSLKHFLDSDMAMATLESHGCGWIDGGCWSLARALSLWTDPEGSISHMYDMRTGCAHHAVCFLPDFGLYMDGDGISTGAELHLKMYQLEFYERMTILDIRGASTAENDPQQIWEQTAGQIHALLEKTFGPWQQSDIRRQLAAITRDARHGHPNPKKGDRTATAPTPAP